MLSKEELALVSRILSDIGSTVEMKLGRDEIQIILGRVSELKLGYAVFINGQIDSDKGFPWLDKFDPVTEKLWCKRYRNKYPPKDVKKLLREVGRKKALTAYPDLEEKVVFYSGYHSSLSKLTKQLGEIEGLVLICPKQS